MRGCTQVIKGAMDIEMSHKGQAHERQRARDDVQERSAGKLSSRMQARADEEVGLWLQQSLFPLNFDPPAWLLHAHPLPQVVLCRGAWGQDKNQRWEREMGASTPLHESHLLSREACFKASKADHPHLHC